MDYDLFQEWLDKCPVEIKSFNMHGDIAVAAFHVPSDYDSNAYDHGREMEDYPEQYESDHSVRSYIYGDGNQQ